MKKLIALALLAMSYATFQAQVVINEVDADQVSSDTAEFVELYGTPNLSLDGHVIVMYNGNNDSSYGAYDLDGMSLDENGFFVLGNAGVMNMDMMLPSNGLQNGADAVALYAGNADDFPDGTGLTNANLVDYMVYDTDDEDDAELLGLLSMGGQLNENELGSGEVHSNSRIPDGGTALSTMTYTQQSPTPGTTNILACDGGSLTNNELEDYLVCVEDMMLSTIEFDNTGGAEGDTYVYVVTDIFGFIQFISDDDEIDFFGEAIGESLVWGLSHNGMLDPTTTASGEHADDISLMTGDCLSFAQNSVLVTKENCDAPNCDADTVSVNSMSSVFLCLGEDDLEVLFSNSSATPEFSYDYVIADSDHNIISIQSGDSFDFDGQGSGTWFIYGISYIGALDAASTEAGDPVSGIVAETCLSTSPGALVNVSECTDGCSDLFFSEYIEGSSNNKAIEIYNPKDIAVNLDGYVVNLYANGNTNPGNTLALEGTLAAGETYVIGNTSAGSEITSVADVLASVTNFNGDDALELTHGGIVIDVIGMVGEDPGSEWMVGADGTKEHTIVRMINVNEGTTDWTTGAAQWDTYPQDTFEYLGSHSANACATLDIPSVSFTTNSQTVEEGTLVTVSVTNANPIYDFVVNMEVVGGTATEMVDYNSSFPIEIEFDEGIIETQDIQFMTIDDAMEEDDETIMLMLTSETDDIQITGDSHTVTIDDNDAVIDYTEIADITTVNEEGVVVTLEDELEVRGVVYGVNLRPGGLQFTLIDPTDGIGIFNLDDDLGYTVNEGDSIHVVGVVDQFNGLTQIVAEDVTFIDSDNELKNPTVVTALNEITESDLVQINCVQIVDPSQWAPTGSGFNVDVTDGTNTYAMRIDNDVDLFGMEAPEGAFNLVGIGGQFDNSSPYFDGYQISPRYAEDIQVAVDMGYFIEDQDGNPYEDGECLFVLTPSAGIYSFTADNADASSYNWSIENLTGTGQSVLFDLWDVDGVNSGIQDLVLILEIDNGNGCTATIMDTICGDYENSILELESFALSIFPNPSQGQINIQADQNIDQIVIRNILGAEVYNQAEFRSFAIIDLRDQAKGVYSVEVFSGDSKATRRIIIE